MLEYFFSSSGKSFGPTTINWKEKFWIESCILFENSTSLFFLIDGRTIVKSYLDLKEKTGFPLWESNFEGDTNPDATIFLRNDGVYIWVGYPKTYESIKKITLNSLATHAQDCSNLPSYIWSLSLEKWNASNFVEYLRKQFTPIY